MGDWILVLQTARVDNELFRRLSIPYDHKGVNIYFFHIFHRSRDMGDMLLVLQTARVDDELFRELRF